MKLSINRTSLTYAVIAGTALIILLLKWTEPDKNPDINPLPVARVELVSVASRDIAFSKTLNGRLIPARKAQIRFEVAGQLRQRLVEPGQRVDQSQVMLMLATEDYKNAEVETRAQLEIEKQAGIRDQQLLELSKQNRVLQQKEVKRLQKLVGKSLTSLSRLEGAKQQLSVLRKEEAQLQYSMDTAKSRLAMRQSSWERANRNLQRCQLRSPWNATVNQVFVQEGDYVSSNQVVIDLIDDTGLEFVLNLRGQIAHKLKPGEAVDITINGETVRGEIIALQVDPDLQTFTHELRVRLPAGIGYPGQVVRAMITLPELKQALLVPVTSLLFENDKQYVFVYIEGKLHRRSVDSGDRVGNEQVILKGLTAGEQVVSRDVASLSDEQQVEVIQSAL